MKKIKQSILFIFLVAICFVFGACNLNASGTDRTYSYDSDYQNPITFDGTITPSKIVEDTIDAVVTVEIVNKAGNAVSLGSGVAVHAGGYIATNYHVISNVALYPESFEVVVFLNGDIETAYDANLLWYNSQVDCALIQCENGNIPFVQMNDRVYNTTLPIAPLETVIAIGTSIDISLQNTYTMGYISGLKRASISNSNLYQDLIQHTAPINHGNSGGPLFDSYGKLIGLNALGLDDGHSVFFAVPIYPVMLVIDKVVALNEAEVQSKLKLPKIGITVYDKNTAEYVTTCNYVGNYCFIQDSTNETLLKNDELLSIRFLNAQKNRDITFLTQNRNYIVLALLAYEDGDTVQCNVNRMVNGERENINVTTVFQII